MKNPLKGDWEKLYQTTLKFYQMAPWTWMEDEDLFAVENPVDAASLFIQKAHHMKEYLEGELYYGGNAEKRSVAKRIEFLQTLKDKSSDKAVKEECERLLEMWKDSSLAF